MSKTPTGKPVFQTKLIKDIAKILNESDLSEIEVERGDLRIRVARTLETQMQYLPAQAAPIASAPTAPAPAPATATETASAAATAEQDEKGTVTSPMVGTVYLRPNPDSDPFISVGDSVNEGDTVLLVEAMKTFNPIKAPHSGTVKRILIEDGQPVEFGEALLVIG